MALKLGTENKNKTYAAIGLGIVVLLVAAWRVNDIFFSSPSGPPAPAAAPVRPAPRRGESESATGSATASNANATLFAHEAVALPSASALDPTLHPEVMAQTEDTTYNGDGRNIFSPNSAPAPIHIEQARAPARPQAVIPTGPPPPPPPPNIDLKFYAYYAPHVAGLDGGQAAGQKRVCLLHGEDIFIAAEGDVVDRRYKVIKINPFSVDVEDLAYSHTQSLPLSQN